MKILNANQIKSADAFTIKQEGITSFDLMERAAEKITRKNNIQNYSTEFTYVINYSLLTKMTKDTHLTDSIFGLNANQ